MRSPTFRGLYLRLSSRFPVTDAVGRRGQRMLITSGRISQGQVSAAVRFAKNPLGRRSRGGRRGRREVLAVIDDFTLAERTISRQVSTAGVYVKFGGEISRFPIGNCNAIPSFIEIRSRAVRRATAASSEVGGVVL